MKLRPRRLAVLAASVAALVLGIAAPASAHVTVNPNEAAQGGYAKLTFRVPNERANAGTVKLAVQLPQDHPITSVSVQPHDGWTYEVSRRKLDTPIKGSSGDITDVVDTVTWSGGPIKPGEFDEFSVSVGPLPKDASSLTFKAVQTYENGEVVRWVDEAVEGQPAPKSPAPVLTLTAASGTDAASHDDAAAPSPGSSGASQSDVDAAKTFGIIGFVLGALGLAIGGLALAQSRRSGARA
jgi:uncharacterized protein YcnI